MIEQQLLPRGIRDPRVLAAFAVVPREAFVPPEMAAVAYDDAAQPIGEGQTISQPYIVAVMAQALDLQRGDVVLEVGGGSGYAAAVMSRLAGHVFSIERLSVLAERARARLAQLGYHNVDVVCGDGTLGLPERAPFDAIAVAAGGPTVPTALRQQLAVGGRLVIPLGDSRSQTLLRLRRDDVDEWSREDLGAVRFVPLIGQGGWDESDR